MTKRQKEYNKHGPFEDFEWFVETDFEDDKWYEEDRNSNDDFIDELEEEDICDKW